MAVKRDKHPHTHSSINNVKQASPTHCDGKNHFLLDGIVKTIVGGCDHKNPILAETGTTEHPHD
jgi:hypothetical protein